MEFNGSGFCPPLMLAGLSVDLIQVAFRIGDSVTVLLLLLFGYLGLILPLPGNMNRKAKPGIIDALMDAALPVLALLPRGRITTVTGVRFSSALVWCNLNPHRESSSSSALMSFCYMSSTLVYNLQIIFHNSLSG
ncbi:AbgT family transporter [Vibrio metschnikovii]